MSNRHHPQLEGFKIPFRFPKRGIALLVFLVSLTLTFSKTVEELAQELLNGSERERRDAAYELDQMGADAAAAVPALIKALDDSQQQVWFHSIQLLAKIGPASEPAIPKLIEDLTSGGGRRGSRGFRNQKWYRTSYALGRIGPSAIPALLEAMDAPDAGKRAGAAEALQWMGEQAISAVPTLLQHIENEEDEEVRLEMSEALGACGPAALPHLKKAILHKEPHVRAAGLRAISQIGTAASDVVPDVIDLWNWESETAIKSEILNALDALKVQGNTALPVYLQALFDKEETIRHAAINGVLLWEPPNETSVPLIESLLNQANPEAQETGLLLATHLGYEAHSLADLIIRDLHTRDLDSQSQEARKTALVSMGPAALPAIFDWSDQTSFKDLEKNKWVYAVTERMGQLGRREFIRALDRPAPSSKRLALYGLQTIGPAVSEAQDDVVILCQADQEPVVRAAALECLAHIGNNLKGQLSVFENAFLAEEPEVRRAAAIAVSVMGETALDLLPQLEKLLRDDETVVRLEAIRSMGQIGPKADTAVPEMIRLLPEATDNELTALVQALGLIGSGEESVIPALIGMFSTADTELKVRLLNAFGRFGSSAKASLELIDSMLSDESVRIRTAALKSWVRVQSDSNQINSALIQALEDEAFEVRQMALETVIELGPDARETEEMVFACLNDSRDKALALQALKKLEPQSVSQLIQALDHEDAEIRMFSCNVLAGMGEKARPAVPALKARLNDSYRPVRRLAESALEKLQ